MRSRFIRALLVCAALLPLATLLPRADTVAQPLPFSQDWTDTGLIAADNTWSGVSGIIGYRGDGMVSSTGVNPQTVLADGSGTPVNVIANQTSTSLTTGGIAEFQLTNPAIALQGSGTARAPHIVITLNTLGRGSIHVSYNLRDIDGTADNAVQPIALQYRIGTSGNYTNVAAAFVADASTGPSLATLVTPVSVDLPADAADQPVVQLRVITTDAAGSDEWIAIDDISVTGTPVSATNPSGTISADAQSYSVGDPIQLTVHATPGTNPTSIGMSVTGNLTAIGLGTPLFADQGNNTFTFGGTIPGGVSGGLKSISATITDSNSPPRSSTTPPISIAIVSPTAPTATGSATPSSVPAGSTTSLTVNVAPGTNPASTGLTVVGDLSSIGGSSAQVFTAGANNSFTFSATVDAGTAPGAKALPIAVSDAEGRSGGFNLPLTVTAPLADSTIVISQLYGGGGNANATYRNDYIQLYNRGTTTVDLTGWSLQYASATGNSWDNRQPLGGKIEPGQYYLVALASGGAVGAALPDANVNGQINMSATTGKIALADTYDLLTGVCPLNDVNQRPHVRDFVGYGASATCHEGAANAPAPSNTTALLRLGAGFIDTNENGNDFTAGTPAPVRTAPIVELGPQVIATDPRANAGIVPRDATILVSFTEPVDVFGVWFDISCATSGSHASATFAGNATDHYITPNDNFAAGEQCTVTVFKDQVADQDTDDATPGTDHLPANYTWSFTVADGAAPPFPASVHLTMGNPSQAVANTSEPDNFLMEKPEFALSYNRDLGRPNWASWHLSAEWIGNLTRNDTFRADPQVPPDWYRVQSFDFQNSGFDRGHMVPNADRDNAASIPINQATFLMSNMVAQAPDNNQGPWANLENYLRTLIGTTANPINELYIVAGPAGAGGTGSNGAFETIAGGHVTVPAYTWKVALVLPAAAGDDVSRVTCSTRTIAVIVPNVQGIRTSDANDWMQYLTTVDAVETLTGLDFFSAVPAPIQHCIEAGVNGVNPKNDQTIAFAQPVSHAFGDADFALDATASSGLPVSLAVLSGPATVSGNMLHITGVGAVTIRAAQAGDDTYYAADDVVRSFDVMKATPAWNALSSPTIEAGTGSTVIGGVIIANGLVPPGSVAITMGGITLTAPIDANGQFSAAFDTSALRPVSSPYAIQFAYAGSAQFDAAAASAALTVVDTTAPSLSDLTATPDVIGPPNHKMIEVLVGYTASDITGAACRLAVSSSEAADGAGDGNTAVDWTVLDAHHVQLRAERSGNGGGRVYTITASCSDGSGNTAARSVAVSVPK